MLNLIKIIPVPVIQKSQVKDKMDGRNFVSKPTDKKITPD
jgi:hypothetical protein